MRALLYSVLLLCPGFLLAVEPSTSTERLATELPGKYANTNQAHADTSYRMLVLHIARIWADRTNGPWFYFEQALASAPDQPYRQVIYQIASRADGSLELRAYNPPDPISITGAWRDPARFAKIAPGDLLAREACTIHLRSLPDGSFQGATEGRGCPSDLGQAAYATTELTVRPRELILWERGFNSSNAQVWGPAHGGYLFTRE